MQEMPQGQVMRIIICIYSIEAFEIPCVQAPATSVFEIWLLELVIWFPLPLSMEVTNFGPILSQVWLTWKSSDFGMGLFMSTPTLIVS